MRVIELVEPIAKLFQKRSRRAVISKTRAYVEFRQIRPDELPRLVDALKLSAVYLTRAEWFEVNAPTGRVVFAFEEDAYDLEELIEVVEAAESTAGFEGAPFAEDAPDHPADIEIGVQHLVELVADACSTLAGLGLWLSPIPSLPLSSNVVAILSILRGSPRLRRGFEQRLGVDRTEFFLNLASSVAQGVAQRPGSSLVDVLHKVALVRELQARRQLWLRREPDLMKEPSVGDPAVLHRNERPIPLPGGPIEEYADRAWFVSLSGFALSLVTTRSLQRATAALFGGLPRPARIGRDVFAADLSRILAGRGILVLNREVLRQLDRIDCLVLQGDLVVREKFVVASVLTEDQETAEEARTRARSLFDQEQPLKIQTDGLWRLGPWELSQASMDMGLHEQARERAQNGALVLSLERAGRVVAVVEVEIMAQTGIEELIATAHEAQMRVVLMARGEGAAQGFNTDDVISEAEGLRAGIRRLQRAGHAVCLVATGASPGLPLADCAIGLLRSGEPIPWGAQLICREDLADVRFIISACAIARRVSRQCVNIALGAATFGTLASAGGLLRLTTRRVMFVINVANLISMANGMRNSFVLERRVLPQPRDPTPWHALDARGVLRRLGALDKGLGSAEVGRRRPVAQKARQAVVELGEAITDELFNPLTPLLAAGAGLSAVSGSVTDAAMVGGVVGLNAFVGGVQRFRTERKIRELSRGMGVMALVRRDDRELWLDARSLVPGDIVRVAPGDVVPADCRVLEEEALEVDASTITGESLPVSKSPRPSFESHVADRSSMLYAGTVIASGRATAVVVAVGNDTEAERGATVTKKPRLQGGVEQRLKALMDLTAPVAIAAGVGVIGGGLLRGRKLEDLVGAGVSLAVASVPEGLPILATAAQLSAAQRLAKKNALVRNVRSIEALGRVDVICLDKTGTVTEGRVELSFVSDGEEEEALLAESLSEAGQRLLAAGLRASAEGTPRRAIADPTDDGLWRAAERHSVEPALGRAGWTRKRELPFASVRAYHATLGESGAGPILTVKGAPEVILPLCHTRRRGSDRDVMDGDTRFKLAASAARLAARGFRVLAVAERQMADGASLEPSEVDSLGFLGFLVFSDPVRPTAALALERLGNAGVRTLMITGDHPQTAAAIAGELGLGAERVLSGAELAQMSEDELDRALLSVNVFARATPIQKVRVVRALQRAGHVVAMVGDGANDAPALRLANVGVAVGEHSTAAARAAADVVLLDGRIETLIDAIGEGRAIWVSIRDAVSILLGGNFGEIAFTLGAGLIDGQPPLNARQLLLVNLLTDVAPAMAIALRPPSPELLATLTNQRFDDTLGAPLTRDIALRAGVTALGAGSAWLIARITGTRTSARTVGLAALVGTQLGQTLRSGGLSRPVLITGLGSAALMFGIIQTPLLSHFFGCRPLGPFGWATAVGASAAATGLSHVVANTFDEVWERSSDPFAEVSRGFASIARRLPFALPEYTARS